MTSSVVIEIDGRPALPLRALAYVTAWAEAPDSIVHALRLEPKLRVGGELQLMAGRRIDIPNRRALNAWRMNADRTATAIPHTQWHAVATELTCLTMQLQADERQGADGENHARWRAEATLALPDDVFVWVDDFERWFAYARPLAIPSDDDMDLWRIEQARLYEAEDLDLVLAEGMADFARPGQLDFTVVFPTVLTGKIWRYWAAPLEPCSAANTSDKSRGGRPRTLHKKAKVIAALMAEFEATGAFCADPRLLPGSAADLLDAFQRIEKHVTEKNVVFTSAVAPGTFQSWLSVAGFGFGAGRARANQAHHWTRLAPQIIGKITPEVFCLI